MRLKKGTQFLDQYDNTDIAQTFSSSQLGNITEKNGAFSNKFKLPLTTKNRDILEFPDNFNDISRTQYTKFDIDLVDAGAVIASGFLRISIVENENEVQCTFFSNNSGWFNPLKEKSLKDLDLTAWSHTWENSTMKSRIDADPDEGYCYPVIDYTYGGTRASFDLLDIYLFPAMFVHTVLRQIFDELGYVLEGELLDLYIFKRMIIPFSDTDFTKPPSETSSDEFEPYDAVNTLVTATTYTMSVSATTTFAPSSDGFYTINSKVIFDVQSVITSAAVMVVKLNKNGSEIQRSSIIFDVGNTGDSEVTVSVEGEEADISSDTFTTTVDVTLFPGSVINIKNEGGLFFYEGSTYVIGDTIQNMATTLPDIKQSDFVKYLFFTFGVIPQVNSKTNVITLNLFRNITEKLDQASDWSNKLDLSSKIQTDYTQLLNNYGSISEIKYKQDLSDSYLESYFNDTAKGFGDGQLDIDNEFIKNKKTIYTAPFAGFTNQFKLPDRVYIANIQFIDTTTLINGPRQSLTPKIAIMTPNEDVEEQTGGGSGYTEFTITSTVASSVTCQETPITFFAKQQVIPLINKYQDSLAYDQIQGVGYQDDTIKELYLEDYERILSNMKYLKAYFRLTEVDINNLDFSKPVYIDRYKSYFYISTIKNYRGSGKLTQCELIKIS